MVTTLEKRKTRPSVTKRGVCAGVFSLVQESQSWGLHRSLLKNGTRTRRPSIVIAYTGIPVATLENIFTGCVVKNKVKNWPCAHAISQEATRSP